MMKRSLEGAGPRCVIVSLGYAYQIGAVIVGRTVLEPVRHEILQLIHVEVLGDVPHCAGDEDHAVEHDRDHQATDL
jgi:hypothetical protein